MSTQVKTTFRVGRLLIPVTLDYVREDRINLHFPYNKKLLDTVKDSFEGREWLGPIPNKRTDGPKLWQIPVTQRNNFILDYLQKPLNQGPYAKYDNAMKPEILATAIERVREYESKRFGKYQLFQHQRELVAHGLLTKTCMWAAEMGVGKTLAAFILMEMLKDEVIHPVWWWVAPNSALRAFDKESRTWFPRVDIRTMTYENFKGRVIEGSVCPSNIVFDEMPKIKTWNTQRSVAARNLTNEMREIYPKDEIVIIGMSGAPSPKSPLDWWHQIEVIEPGYLSEKDIYTFREKLGIVEEQDDGAYKKVVAWRDSVDRCAKCSKMKDDPVHSMDLVVMGDKKAHAFVPGIDAVSNLHNRLRGVAIFKLKKDCLDLPDKIYEQVVLKPTEEIIAAAQLVTKTARRVVTALVDLRMLSDGFQYTKVKTGEKTCTNCGGSGQHTEFYDPQYPDTYAPDEWVAAGKRPVYDSEDHLTGYEDINYAQRLADCPNCGASGRVDVFTRTATRVPCPKDDALAEDLDVHEDLGRLCVYAGFTDSVDRVVENCHKAGWTTIRADGRGWEGKTPYGELLPNERLVDIFQDELIAYPKICFVGQPGSAGEGLTLTAASTIIFWSNDFNGNSRMQAEDRIHRPGMDLARGARIKDYIHLQSDLYVLKNLKEKKDLQKQTMTGFKEFMGCE